MNQQTTMKRPDPKKLQAMCDDWNSRWPIGQPVTVLLDKDITTGTRTVTATRSLAQVLSGHSAVIWLDKVSGCYDLDRVKAEVTP